MNRKIIGKILGFLLVMESFLFMPPACISWMDGERVALTAFFTAAAVAAVVGYFAIRLVNLLCDKGKFGAFAYYCWAAGVATLVLTVIQLSA